MIFLGLLICPFFLFIGTVNIPYYTTFFLHFNSCDVPDAILILTVIHDLSFRCDVGFIGKRCERKDAYSKNDNTFTRDNNSIITRRKNTLNIRRKEKPKIQFASSRHSYRCILGVTHYPC